MKKLVAILFAALALAGCDATPAPVAPPPAGADCPRACDNYRALRCGPATTQRGDPCERWMCESSIGPARVSCIADAPTCADMEACP